MVLKVSICRNLVHRTPITALVLRIPYETVSFHYFVYEITYRSKLVLGKHSSRTLPIHSPLALFSSCLTKSRSTTIEHLWDRQAYNASSVVYIFCQFSSRDQQDLTAILQCMIRQVIEQADEGLLLAMKQLCADTPKQSTPAGLTELFAAACELKSTYLIVDSPDEVPKAEGLLSYLTFFVGAGCKVMVTSRDLSHIRKHMCAAVKMKVCSQIQDLELYISSRFQDSEFPDAEDFTQEIMRKSSNVFLHGKLILDELVDLTTIRQMRKALEEESKGLEQACTSIVQQIDIQPKAKRALAWRLIGWIAFANRRFKLNEVIHAFAVEKDEEEIYEDNTVSPDLLLQLCIGIVVLFDDNTVGLCHATAYDFFRSTVLVSHVMNTDISETCLRYMCLKPFRQGPCGSSAELSCCFHDMVFLGYASRHWGEHLHELEDLEADTESLVQFLILDENLRDAAVQALHFHNGCETDLSNALFEDMPAKQTALHVAAYWNFTRNLKALIESALDTSSKDTQGWTPLHYACANGHFASAELLIDSRAYIDSSDDQGWTPLFWASFMGSLDIVRLLLPNHAKYTRRSKSGYTALHWAISPGETEVVQALLQHHQTQLSLTLKADIQMFSVDDVRRLSTPVGVSPIQVAAEAKHAPIFDLLVAYLQAPGSMVKDDVFQKLWSRESFKVPVAQNAWRTLLKSSRGGKSSKKTKALVHSAESISGQTYLAEDPSRYFKKEWVETSPPAWKAILLRSTIRDGYLNAARLLVETGVDVNFDSKEGPPLHIAAC
ncbi:ankyrin repeat-containing protein [Aspergillus arachidicola]|uniref:Ankyrin repeat-containing protein n=1 Tax=Aspergillus arachidicola TaxID=656916 RepID=A0A2G7FHY3_9EURO|nr:ankyrin repeat-containing protein [Aspergillus arachidicola]